MIQETSKILTTQEIAARFDELAQQEKWFEIQETFFAENISSLEPPGSPYLKDAMGKAAVRKKAKDWVSRITHVYGAYTTHPVVGGNHFAVGRGMDVTVEGFGRIKMDQIMLYEVKDGQIISEQFFY